MTDYQVNFVYSFCSIGVSVNSIDEDTALDTAEKIVFAELGLTIPKNVSIEIQEIN